MKIIKLAEELSLNQPNKPSPPAQEKIKQRDIYNAFGGLLTRGKIVWDRASDRWTQLKTSEDKLVYFTYYSGYVNNNDIYRLDIYFYPSETEGVYSKAILNLHFDPEGSVGAKQRGTGQDVATFVFTGEDVMKTTPLVQSLANLSIRGLRTPEETKDDFTPQKESIRLTRRPSEEVVVRVGPRLPLAQDKPLSYEVSYVKADLSTGEDGGKKVAANSDTVGYVLKFDKALSLMTQLTNKFIMAGFVDDSSPQRIPQGANQETWDFELGTWKQAPEQMQQNISLEEDGDDMGIEGGELLTLGSTKVAQDFGGYFTGDVPDYAAGMLGSSSVDSSQINSMFGKAGEAINLVNQFDSSLLSNISFIFNFSKSGAYGVYLSELDRAIKTKALQKKLESEGYRVEPDDTGFLRAYPTQEDKDPQEIQNDIERLYGDLEEQGGTAFGINMNAVLNASKQDAMQSGSTSPDIWEWMALLHLGGTIVHEAVHAKGHHDEGPSENAEDRFINWALPKINEEYKNSLEAQGRGDEYTPLTVGTEKRMANNKQWYKTAQMSYYVPQAFIGDATGSDLSGRHALKLPYESGRAPWGMMMQQDQSIPIEKRLGRQYMSPLPRGLSQEHDSYEEQLRKYTEGDQVLDPNATLEELLSEGYEEDRGYGTMESLLDEMRVKPLIVPLNKDASASNKIQKKATLFGWMNNLEISDGSTIPGLSDRVMAWDDRDESFSEEEDWIKQQPRYNPTYDVRGFYYRYIEPRFRPQLWDQMVSNLPGVHPAKRFANKLDSDVAGVFKILGLIKSKLKKKNIKATRILLTEDIIPYLEKVFDGECKVELFDIDTMPDGEELFAAWISDSDISFKDIEKAEMFISGYSEDGEEEAEKLLGLHEQKSKNIKHIMNILKDICKEYGVKDFYAVGGYPRDLVLGTSLSSIEDLDFSCSWPNQAVKIGGILAEKLGVQNVQIFHRTMTLSFSYKGIKLDFKGNFNPIEVRGGLRDQGIPTTPLNMDVYNRDFTMNMMIYNVLTGKIHDVTGLAKKDIDRKDIKTFFDPDYVCKQNPIIILRALKFHIRYGFDIDPVLEIAMKKNANLLFSGRYTRGRLAIARDNVKKEGKKQAKELFKKFGLEKLEEM